MKNICCNWYEKSWAKIGIIDVKSNEGKYGDLVRVVHFEPHKAHEDT